MGQDPALRLIEQAAQEGWTTLDLSGQDLTELPPAIGRLTHLETLILGKWDRRKSRNQGNRLQTLPPELSHLPRLTTLALSYNQFTTLPPVVLALSQLTSLYLWGNSLSSLPPEIAQLSQLETLNLYGNRFSILPPVLEQLPQLEKLDLRQNPIPIPPEILGPKEWYKYPGDLKQILDFYHQVQDPEDRAPCYEAKVLIVGEGGAGKTTLAQKLQDANYALKDDEKSTQGIEVIRWDFPLADGTPFRVNLWDFGGQEIYHETHQFFLTARSLYLLVADSRKENTNFYWWLKSIELLAGDSPVLLVQNEKQDRRCTLDEGALRKEFPQFKASLRTNLATNRDLEAIHQAIHHHLTQLPYVGIPLPKLWIRVRATLENDPKNYIAFDDYRQRCQANGITDRANQLSLSTYLHDLGVCLHFHRDPVLKRWVILKPQWATAAYKVLDNADVVNNLGCFTRDQLEDIWHERQYAEMRDELLQLMQNFKLCYEIPGKPHSFIAPRLLPETAPAYDWDTHQNLILRIIYEFMPKGILSRLIVEMHRYIEAQRLVWRRGVVLNNGSARLEAIEHPNRGEITLRVSGTHRRDLLTVALYRLDEIHATYENLKYDTLIPCNCSQCFGSQDPHQYPYRVLRRFLSDGQPQIQCQKSYAMVDVRRLIDDVAPPEVIQPYPDSHPDAYQLPRRSPGLSSEQLVVKVENHFQTQTYQEQQTTMGNTIYQYGSGDNIGGDKVMGDKIGIQHNHSQDLTQAAQAIKTLLDQLSQDYDLTSAIGKGMVYATAEESLQKDPTLKQRVVSALKGAGEEALSQAIDHPAAKVFIAGAKGFITP